MKKVVTLLIFIFFLYTISDQKGWFSQLSMGVSFAMDVDKIETELMSQISNLYPDEQITFIIHLKNADLSPVLGNANEVIRTLKATAEESQRNLIKMLSLYRAENEVSKIKSFWIDNLIIVRGTKGVIFGLSDLTEVEMITANHKNWLPLDIPGGPCEPGGIEWGIQRIRADDVWNQYNITGKGVVVGNIDSGVDATHSDLHDKFRGSGTGKVSWKDFAGDGQGNYYSSPTDDANGHGTHTMGTMIGSGSNNRYYGVAPDATWVAAKAFPDNSDWTSDEILLEACQWIMDPNEDGNADDAPGIVNCSWTADGIKNTMFYDVIEAWNAANIFSVFCAGNYGCPTTHFCGNGTVYPPANYPNTIGVGGIQENGGLAPQSSCGPAPPGWPQFCIIKPDVVAPGMHILSSVPLIADPSGYACKDGTSMAAPHVAGTLALMLEACPGLTFKMARKILELTSADIGEPGKDNKYGAGMVDAFEAVTFLLNPLLPPDTVFPFPFTNGETGIQINWTVPVCCNTRLGGYNIYRGMLGSLSYTKLNTSTIPVSQRSFIDCTASPGVTYLYRVSSVDISNNEGGLSIAKSTRIPEFEVLRCKKIIKPNEVQTLTIPLDSIAIASTSSLVSISLKWEGSKLDLIIKDPSENVITSTSSEVFHFSQESTSILYVVHSKKVGDWSISVVAVDVSSDGENYTLEIKAGDETNFTAIVPIDYRTIQEAIDAVYVSGGGIVQVRPGIYKESIILKNRVILRGTRTDLVTIDGGGIGKTVTLEENAISEISHITIIGSNPTGKGDYGITITGGNSSLKVKNCLITGNNNGVSARGNSVILLINNTITNNKGTAIDCRGNATIYGKNLIVADNGTGVSTEGNKARVIINYSDFYGNNKNNYNITNGIGNINTDPLFINPLLGNYAIQNDSPCKGTGESNSDMGYEGTAPDFNIETASVTLNNIDQPIGETGIIMSLKSGSTAVTVAKVDENEIPYYLFAGWIENNNYLTLKIDCSKIKIDPKTAVIQSFNLDTGKFEVIPVYIEDNYIVMNANILPSVIIIKEDKVTPIDNIWVIYNTSNSGLPSNIVKTIAIDDSGNKWIGTDMGLVKFDGSNWIVYNASNSGLSCCGNNITTISIDNSQNKWIGVLGKLGYSRVVKFDGINWTNYNYWNNSAGKLSIAIDDSQNKWIGACGGTTKTLGKFDNTKWTFYDPYNSALPSDCILSMAIDDSQNKWIGTTEGLTKFDGINWTIYDTSNSDLPSNNIFMITVDDSGNKWMNSRDLTGSGKSAGLVKFNGKKWTIYNTSNSGIPNNYVNTVAIDRFYNKWIGTELGLVKFDGTNWTVYDTSNSGLPINSINSIVIDKYQNKWFGTNNGLIVYNENGVVSVEEMIGKIRSEKKVPKEFILYQNYPNPFNSETTIGFVLPKEGQTTLRVYDITGKLIKTLINEHKTVGYYSVKWNGQNEKGEIVPSGLYIYKITSGKYSSTKRMLLLK